MKRIIKLEPTAILPNSFRGKLKEGLVRCKNESKNYHQCVTKNYL